ncbi:MAG: periplasmic heavy metal sensor [Amaricoccus sp.]
MVEPRTSPQTRMKWALIGSLGLNLALAGLILGAIVKGPPPPPPPPGGLWFYGRSLPEPYRGDLGRALRDNRGDWAGPREALGDQRAAFAAALTAEPYDPAALAAILARQPALFDELTARGTSLLLDQIARMSPAERAGYAQALLSRREPPGHGRH